MASTVIISALLFFFFVFMVASTTPESDAQSRNNGFSIEIIHIDSPSSPFYNSSDTFSSRIKKAAQRSLTRLQYLQSSMTVASSNKLVQSPVTSIGGGAYLMKFLLGSIGLEIFAVIDTASDLIWTQCIPCENCLSGVKFDTSKSSSYTNLGCSTKICKVLPGTSCVDKVCQYSILYMDKTSATGVLAADTMTLDSGNGNNFTFPIAFGCGHSVSSETFVFSNIGGLVGLGRGASSLISQLGSVAIGRFSYCLMDYDDIWSRSVMNFGLQAIVSGDDLVITPITTVSGRESSYYLTLDDISVGDQKLNIPPGTFHVSGDGDGGLIIDSGSTLTSLNKIGFDMMVTALKSVIDFPLAADPVQHFQLCYQASKDNITYSFPDVTFHFLGGDVLVGPWNVFSEVDEQACLTVIPVSNGVSVYGNLVQQGFNVGYDLAHMTVSFAHGQC